MCTQLFWSDGAVAGQIRIGSAASKVDLKFDFRVYLDQIPFIGFELFHQLLCSNFLDLIFESECLRVSPGCRIGYQTNLFINVQCQTVYIQHMKSARRILSLNNRDIFILITMEEISQNNIYLGNTIIISNDIFP